MMLLALYLCGYTSLQFEPRHAFHLSFVPLWFVGTALSLLVYAIRARWKRMGTGPVDALAAVSSSRLRWGRGALHALAAVVIVMAPYLLLCSIQRLTTQQLLGTFRRAKLMPAEDLEVVQRGWAEYRRDWYRFSAESILERLATPDWSRQAGFIASFGTPDDPVVVCAEIRDMHQRMPRVIYVALKFKQRKEPLSIFRSYNAPPPLTMSPISGGDMIHPPGGGKGQGFVYFFPIFAMDHVVMPGESAFDAFYLPPEAIDDLEGVYLVDDVSPFPVYVNICLPANPDHFDHLWHLAPMSKIWPGPEDLAPWP